MLHKLPGEVLDESWADILDLMDALSDEARGDGPQASASSQAAVADFLAAIPRR